MPTQSVWRHIDVPLPELEYQNVTAAGRGKGSTTYAAHSHSPMGLELWDTFEALVAAEGQNPQNHRVVQDLDFAQQLASAAEFLDSVSREEDVTNHLQTLLSRFSADKWDLSGGFCFPQQNQAILAKPDLVVQKKDRKGLGVGSISEYSSPPPGKRAQLRRDNTTHIESLYRMSFETKPCWKFAFLNDELGHEYIINNWEIPKDFDAAKMQAKAPLPESWSNEKKKIFHLVRQFYGQMVADKRRYGILHLYERWFFCKRTAEGILKISRSFHRGETSPSVFQAIKTMVGFDDHELDHSSIHPQSASKAVPPKRKRNRLDPPPPASEFRRGGGTLPTSKSSKRGGSSGVGGTVNLAATIYPWDCHVYDVTDSVLLLTTTKDPTVIVKLQSDPQKSHVADEMAHEAAMYTALEGNEMVQGVIPPFFGYSTHLGVAMTCIEKELDDFDDIGLGNLSESLKQSAIGAVQVLSEAGVLHNDIELRNFVKSKSDPNRAKIIDFGRASFSHDRDLLAEQVERTKILLNAEDSTR